jgi:Mn2+/Fe2+ NRAMP family transporter
MSDKRVGLLAAIAPGILIAATGVGAGDLMTASLGGSAVGLGLIWAAGVGAFLKWFLNEGIARWQMATGTTLLEGWVTRLGRWIQWVFLVYLFIWSVFTGGALVTACGVAGTGLLPITEDVRLSKIIWGIVHSLAGLILVWFGGFKLFEKMMSVCIAVMFVAVTATAILIKPDWTDVGSGLIAPFTSAGKLGLFANNLGWVLGVLGGVGGTVTLLSYGYWIREEKRTGDTGLSACRLDLALGYAMTALFGMAMIIIGSRVELSKGPLVALSLAQQLESVMGATGKWIFLVGFWGAVFSSLLGVWQSVPYLFADFRLLQKGTTDAERQNTQFTSTRPYRGYLVALALVSLPLLWWEVRKAQLAYAVMGSLFMPLLALTLLIMNNRSRWVGSRFRNGLVTNIVLIATLVFFAWVLVDKVVPGSSESGAEEPTARLTSPDNPDGYPRVQSVQ